MRVFTQTLTDYQSLLAVLPGTMADRLPQGLRPARVVLEERMLDKQQLLQTLEKYSGVRGWLLFPSERVVLNGNQDLSGFQLPPMSGEFIADSNSHKLSHLGANRWRWTMTSIEEGVENSEATHLLERVTQLADDKRLGRLHYDRIWQEDTQNGLKITTAVLRALGEQADD